jgi:hypothetical protein
MNFSIDPYPVSTTMKTRKSNDAQLLYCPEVVKSD